jgi:hypothetical protein
MTFSQLFKNDIEFFGDIPEGVANQCSERFLVLEEDPIPEWFQQDHKFDYIKEVFGDDPRFGKLHKKIHVNNGRNIDHEYERIPKELQDTYSSLLSRLVLQDEIQNEIDGYCDSQLSDNLVTVHMRTWHDDGSSRRKMFSLESYMAEMDKWDGYDFFIAADNFWFLPQLKQRYGNRVKYYENRTQECLPGQLTDDLTKLSLIELYILSRGNHIIGSYISTFSEVSWYLGGCKADVTIP